MHACIEKPFSCVCVLGPCSALKKFFLLLLLFMWNNVFFACTLSYNTFRAIGGGACSCSCSCCHRLLIERTQSFLRCKKKMLRDSKSKVPIEYMSTNHVLVWNYKQRTGVAFFYMSYYSNLKPILFQTLYDVLSHPSIAIQLERGSKNLPC